MNAPTRSSVGKFLLLSLEKCASRSKMEKQLTQHEKNVIAFFLEYYVAVAQSAPIEFRQFPESSQIALRERIENRIKANLNTYVEYYERIAKRQNSPDSSYSR